MLEQGTHQYDLAELHAGLSKDPGSKDIKDANSNLFFWDYCVEKRTRMNNLTCHNIPQLNVSNTYTELTGEQGNMYNMNKFN